MALPSSGPISLSDIQTEFGGSNPISLSEYYSKGNAPASGAIDLAADFYGTANAYNIEYLVVAGGGGGGYGTAGGGGAGGYIATSTTVAGGTGYTITIGGGGAAQNSNVYGNNGSSSSAFGSSAVGGGGGGNGRKNAQPWCGICMTDTHTHITKKKASTSDKTDTQTHPPIQQPSRPCTTNNTQSTLNNT